MTIDACMASEGRGQPALGGGKSLGWAWQQLVPAGSGGVRPAKTADIELHEVFFGELAQ